MSYVTNLLLHISMIENEQTRMQEVNTYFHQRETRPLISVSDESIPRGWYGGDKYLECHLYLGAYNYLHLDEFIAHLKSIEWEEPEAVQVIVKEQSDDMFRIIQVFPEQEEASEENVERA